MDTDWFLDSFWVYLLVKLVEIFIICSCYRVPLTRRACLYCKKYFDPNYV